MGNTVGTQVLEPAEGIVTVNTQAASNPSAEDSILQRLQQLPQVQQVQQTGVDEQVWQELAAYTQGMLSSLDGSSICMTAVSNLCNAGKLQLPPESTLCFIETYKCWCQGQANDVLQQQHAVNSRIKELDEMATVTLNQSCRSQHSIEEAAKTLISLGATQQHMDDIAARLSTCAARLNAAKVRWDLGQAKASNK